MRSIIVLHSPLSPSAAESALRSAVDEEHRTLLSLSGYKGEKPVLGNIESSQFRVQKRRYSRNDFAGHFYGRIQAESSGSRIEGYLDWPKWARWYMRIWLTFAVLVGIPLFAETLWNILSGKALWADDWVGIVVPPGLILFGLVMPEIGRLFGKKDRQFLVEYVHHSLMAQPEQPLDFS
jgi:hypothetical protein